MNKGKYYHCNQWKRWIINVTKRVVSLSVLMLMMTHKLSVHYMSEPCALHCPLEVKSLKTIYNDRCIRYIYIMSLMTHTFLSLINGMVFCPSLCVHGNCLWLEDTYCSASGVQPLITVESCCRFCLSVCCHGSCSTWGQGCFPHLWTHQFRHRAHSDYFHLPSWGVCEYWLFSHCNVNRTDQPVSPCSVHAIMKDLCVVYS